MAELRRVGTRRVCLSRAAAFDRGVRAMLQLKGFGRLACVGRASDGDVRVVYDRVQI